MRWQPYPAYKDSGVDWLGKIPEHWQTQRLKYLSSLNDENLGETTDPHYEILYVDISSIDASKGIQKKEPVEFKDAPSRARRIVEHGDIIVSTVRTYLRAIAPIIDPEANLIVSTGFAVIRPNEKLDSSFASYALRAPYFVETVVKNSVGVNYPAISAGSLVSFHIAFPSSVEQKTIAAFLNHEVANIDTLIARKERQIELLLEKRSVLITKAVTQGLDPVVPMKDSGIEFIGEIPAHWTPVRSKAMFYEIDERSESGEEELLTVSHIIGVTPRSEVEVNMFLPETFKGYKKCKSGDLVINTMWAWMGALGISEYDGMVSPSYNVYRLREKDEFVPRYLDLLYRTSPYVGEIGRHSKGIWKSRLRLYPDSFFEIFTLKPPLTEQQAIVDHVTKEVLPLDSLIEKLRESIGILKEYRITLISEVVTGKIDVRNE